MNFLRRASILLFHRSASRRRSVIRCRLVVSFTVISLNFLLSFTCISRHSVVILSTSMTQFNFGSLAAVSIFASGMMLLLDIAYLPPYTLGLLPSQLSVSLAVIALCVMEARLFLLASSCCLDSLCSCLSLLFKLDLAPPALNALASLCFGCPRFALLAIELMALFSPCFWS